MAEQIPFKETKGYVQGIIRNTKQYRRLYDENGNFKPNVGTKPLRAEIDSTILRAGGIPTGTIVAGGDQACDPHERGHGPLYADSLIILDVFPRDAKTGYFGDMTRTVLRGRATEVQRKLWNTVKAGQALGVEEQRALLNDLEACQSPRTCPHGRPTMIHLSVDMLERQFGRRGAR